MQAAKPKQTRSRFNQRGLSLLEVMIAAGAFAMVSLGIITLTTRTYELSAKARVRDNARAILRTYADQFLRLQTTEETSTGTWNRWLFNIADTPTGQGLKWGELSDDIGDVQVEPMGPIILGSGNVGVPTTITRRVVYVDPNTGEESANLIRLAAGNYLKATFIASYTFNRRAYTQELTVLRAVP